MKLNLTINKTHFNYNFQGPDYNKKSGMVNKIESITAAVKKSQNNN